MNVTFGRISSLDRVLLTKHLAVMLTSGLTLVEALDTAAEQVAGKFRRVISGVKASVESGRSFADSLQKFPKVFPPIYVSTVRVGEASGTLSENLQHLSRQLEKDYELVRKVRGAMIYPAIVLFATFALGTGIAVFILPKLAKLFASFSAKLPTSTRILLEISRFFEHSGILFIVGLIVAIILLRFLLRSKPIRPLWHRVLLTLPLAGRVVRSVNLARMAWTLGTLLRSGVAITEAVAIVSESLDNEIYRRSLRRVGGSLERGMSLAKTLEAEGKLYPKIADRMVNVGERTGKLDEVLLYLAEFYEADLDHETKNLATTIEPILLLVIGLVVGFVAIAIVTPIYQLTGTLGR